GRQPPAERRLPRPRVYLSPRTSKEPCMTASKTAIPLPLSPVLPDGELLESAMLPGSAEAAAAVAETDARGQARRASRKPIRREQQNMLTPIEKKPEWIKTRAKMGAEYRQLQTLVAGQGLHTVCQEAGCPNIFECWEDREATFLIGGSQCTRRCDFCQI